VTDRDWTLPSPRILGKCTVCGGGPDDWCEATCTARRPHWPPVVRKGWTNIQWKGTEVCMDWRCPECQYQGHIDDDFCYAIRCPKCRMILVLGTEVSITADPDYKHEPLEPLLEEDHG